MAADLTLISGPDELMYSRNPVLIELETTHTDTLVTLEVFDENNNRLVYLTGRPDNDYHVSFDISNILDSIVEFDNPDIGNNFYPVLNTVKKYYCIANEIDSNDLSLVSGPVNIGWNGTDISLFVIKGGVNAESYSPGFPLNYIKTENKFLTWLKYNNVLREQPLFLYYLHQYNSANINIKAVMYFSDGTTTNVFLDSQISVNKYDILAINAGYLARSLNNNENGKTTISYDIEVFDDETGDLRASVKNYLVPVHYFQPVYILNANSLGGFDSHFFEGKSTFENKADKRELKTAYNNISENRQITTGFLHTVTVNTGYKDEDEISTLTEMIINNRNFEVINTSLVPVLVDKGQIISLLSHNSLQSAQIKFSRVYNNLNFTPDEFID